jgi:hypothetical protein
MCCLCIALPAYAVPETIFKLQRAAAGYIFRLCAETKTTIAATEAAWVDNITFSTTRVHRRIDFRLTVKQRSLFSPIGTVTLFVACTHIVFGRVQLTILGHQDLKLDAWQGRCPCQQRLQRSAQEISNLTHIQDISTTLHHVDEIETHGHRDACM